MQNFITRRASLARGLSLAGLSIAGISPLSAQPQKSRDAAPRLNDLTPGPTPIRQAINIMRRKGEHPEEMISRVRSSGYTAVKGARHPGGNVGEPWNSMTAVERDEVVAACRKFDVIIYEVGGYTNLVTPDTKQLRENITRLAHCLEVAESVACPMVGTVAGSRDPSYLINVHPENWTTSTWNLLVRSVKQALRDTSGMRAAIGMEAQVTTIIDSPRAHLRLLEDVGDERLTVNLDPVNMVTLERYYRTTELLNECFDLLGERIMGCHAKDTLILPDRQTICMQEVCPGKGVLDYETYLVRMSRLAWPRALEPEHIADEEYPEAKAYIAGVAARVGVKIY
jgi:sugar phosphate isomerase/epimerase